MKELEMLYEGKVRKVFATENPDQVIVDYKGDATAFSGQKKDTILGKSVVNNKMTNFLFKKLEDKGIPTHLIEELGDRRALVKKVEIVPLEAIIRNKAVRSFVKRTGLKEGMELKRPILEFSYKDDDLRDPMINDYTALAIDISTQEEIDEITRLAFVVNGELKSIFAVVDIELIDFKLEFGHFKGGIVLAGEISLNTCRFWDIHTHDHLDKDRFRRNLGNVEDVYQEVYGRLRIKQLNNKRMHRKDAFRRTTDT